MDNTKRAELHLHTKLSDDISVIGVEEIFENAEELGLNAIAFTNLDNVQDFPKIANCHRRKPELNVIYGAEVRYTSREGKAPCGLTILAKNQAGIKELYKVISSIKNDGVCDLIDLEVLKQNRKNLLVGSCGATGELYDLIEKDKVPYAVTTFYDYFEIFPSKEVLECETNKKIFYLGEELGVPVVAAGNCHYLAKEDKICCDIIKTVRNQAIDEKSEYYIRTTKEMLEEFSYLGNYGAHKVVLENPQILTDVIEKTKPLKSGNYYPVFENATLDLQNLCYSRAHEIYGNPLPETVKERLDTELGFLKDQQIATQYLLAKKLVDFAKEHGQLTTVRGAVGSTLVAFLLGVSEINPLPPHYYCPECHCFEEVKEIADGFDLPQKICPVCENKLKADGHNIPYEVFMGFEGDKLPDIDLNFSGEFVLELQNLISIIFGKTKIAQAGMVYTLSEIIAKGYITEYENITGTKLKKSETKNVLSKIIDVKSSVGVHPCGIMVIPDNMDLEDFTPINKNWAPLSTTHLDFHSLHDTILKQDMLGHSVLDFLLELQKQTGKSIKDVDFNDSKIYDLFRNGDTKGILEFDRDFIRNLLLETSPQNFNELVKISCLCHGTNVWTNNAEHLIKANVCTLSEVIAARDDIMVYLTQKGMDKATAYRIMEAARKGLWAKQKLSDCDKKYFVEELQKHNVPKWYIESLSKIYYMFPKAHAVAYVTNAVRLAWFKLYYPTEFYAAYLSCYFQSGDDKK